MAAEDSPRPTTPTSPSAPAAPAARVAPAAPAAPPAPAARRRERTPRAGRNLPAAVVVGVGLALAALLALYVEKTVFVAVACLAVVLGLRELAAALGTAGMQVPLPPVAGGAAVMVAGAYAWGAEALVGALVLTATGVLLWRLRGARAGYLRDASAGVFAAVYGPFLAGFGMLMLRAPDGADRVVVLILLTACSDVGGYATGVLLGRHPLAPTISPRKSWEGFAGSLAAAAAGGVLAVPLLLGGAPGAGVLVGLAAAVTATLGDLGESLIKRDVGIKDMGSLLPGHGGVMDRLDSLLPCAPVVHLLLGWLSPG